MAYRCVREDVYAAVLVKDQGDTCLYILGVAEVHKRGVYRSACLCQLGEPLAVDVAGYDRCAPARERTGQRAPKSPGGTGNKRYLTL